MRPLKILFTTVLIFISTIVIAQPISTQLPSDKPIKGTVYFLPKTVIRFHILVEKKEYTPGVFCKYAEKYLQLKGVGQEQDIVHRVVDYRMNLIGVRDTSKCYLVNIKGKSTMVDIRLSDDGILLAVNDTPKILQEPAPFIPSAKPTRTNPQQLMSAEIQNAGSNAKKAELVAQQIAELQEHRQQLITGEAEETPTDKAQLQLMLDQIEREKEALLSLFTGTTTCDTTEQVVMVCPDKEMKREVIFRISKQRGLVDKDDLSGIPFYLSLEDLHQTIQQPDNAPENKKEEGFYTIVPGIVRLTLYREDRQLATYNYPFAQFGFTELRGVNLFKQHLTHLRLNPITGAIEKLQAEIPEK